MTDEVADWSGDWVVSEIAARRLRLQIHSTVNDSTGSTIMIIIVGPMIGPTACCALAAADRDHHDQHYRRLF